MPDGLDALRRRASTQSLFAPTTLARAIERMAYVQADPIRAPARAQDLILRQRVADYRAGDLERRYESLGVAEDVFINYGFVSHPIQALMHPRPDVTVPAAGRLPWSEEKKRRAREILRFVRRRGAVHPREVDARFAHGTVKNYWGGTSNATTQLLEAMHYSGLLRVVRRDAGTRIYAAHEHDRRRLGESERRARLDALVDVVLRIYSPLPAASVAFYVRRLRYAVPQWADEITPALARARSRLEHGRAGGVDWYWTDGAPWPRLEPDDGVRLFAPFDPVVQDRARFEMLWGWVYRFEAYTPPAKRKLGYYALPLHFRDRVIGWANLSVAGGVLEADFGYASGSPPRDPTFRRELEREVERVRKFLVSRA